MSAFSHLPVVQALALTLLHFLWQGLLLGAVAWLCLWLMRRASSQARYLAACSTLALMLVAPVATFGILRVDRAGFVQGTVQTAPRPSVAPVLKRSEISAATPIPSQGLKPMLSPSLPWALGLWILGVVLMTLRLLGGWLWLRRKLWKESEMVGSDWQTTLLSLSRKLGIHQEIILMKARSIRMPMVVGWLEPIILVPAAILSGMDPMALEAILIHELAHIRRHDYLVNLLQCAVEVLLFYHPAVWWVSRQIRIERENCCDDMAAAACGDALLYAKALTCMEDFRRSLSLNPELAMAADGGNLMNRIQRLLQPQLPPSPRARAGLMVALAASLLGAGTAMTIAEEKKPKERTEIVVRDSDENLKARMSGDVKVDATAKDGFVLGEGAKVEISATDKEHIKRRFSATNEKGEVKRTYKVDGEEKPLDAEAEAWLKSKLGELEKLQVGTGGGKHKMIVLRSGPGCKTISGEELKKIVRDAQEKTKSCLKGHEKELEACEIVLRQHGKELEAKAQEAAKHAQKCEKELRLRLNVMPHEALDLDDSELCEPFWAQIPDLHLEDFDGRNLDTDIPHMRIEKFYFGRPGDPKQEAEHLKKEIEVLQKRLDKLQKKLETMPKESKDAKKG